eukprot:2621769-Pleurochrysis_carterae.AAC.2
MHTDNAGDLTSRQIREHLLQKLRHTTHTDFTPRVTTERGLRASVAHKDKRCASQASDVQTSSLVL